ncbi:MAG: Hsp20/alpha crystallin family protein [Fuerstiella sp.]|nr:Hsp20/alpha crystallin family protein [Fuerstiella sp.]
MPCSEADHERRQVRRRAPVTVHQSDSRVIVEVDVPGFTLEDLEITVRSHELLISGNRDLTIPSDAKVLLNNRHNISVDRSVKLDDSLDPESVDAVLEFGVLKIELRRKPEAQARSIRIRTREYDIWASS